MNIWCDRLFHLGITSAFTAASLLCWEITAGAGAMAQSRITADETLGNERSRVNRETIRGIESDRISGGATRGQNLFHSFEQFDIGEGLGAYFDNSEGIRNIFSRVTGADASEILGRLGVIRAGSSDVLGNANLFFINPNGILFGQNASLDLGGSFAATTANGIQFGEQGFFSATNPEVPSGLLTIEPSAFFFNQIAAQPITQFGPPNIQNPTYVEGLRVSGGRSLLLLGGAVNIQDGRLRAPGGRVELGGVAGVGTIGLESNGNLLSLSFPDNVDRADVSITGLSDVDVTAGEGGDIAIHARNLNLLDGSDICAGVGLTNNCGNQRSSFEVVGSQAGDIVLNAQGTIRATTTTTANRIGIENNVNFNAVGNGGNIVIRGRSLLLEGDSQIVAIVEGQGNAGSVSVHVRDRLVLAGRVYDGFYAGAYLSTQTGGRGNAGDISINARDIQLSNGSVIFSGISAGGIGQGGDIEIQTGSLSLTDGSQIGATLIRPGRDEQGNPRPGGQGRGGDIRIIASDSVTLSGTNPQGFSSGIVAFTEAGASGQAGEILIEADILQIASGAVVGASTANRGNAGSITINVRDLEAINGGQIVSATRKSGRAGEIRLNATGNITLSGIDLNFEERWERARQYLLNSETANITDVNNVDDIVITEGDASGIFTNTAADSTGRGGTITLNTANLNLSDGATISAQSAGGGRSGNIDITATGDLHIIDSDILTSAEASVGGRIRMVAADIFLNGEGNIRTDVASGGENAGSIDITANTIQLRDDSDIRTNVGGQGSGGNITIDANAVVAFDDSDILAYSRSGSGGNIKLPAFFSENYVEIDDRPDNERLTQTELNSLDRNSQVDVDARGQVSSGTITTPDTSFIQNSLTDLPETAIDTENLVANSCVVRSQEQQGRFIITGAGGLPQRPGDAPLSSFPTNSVRSTPNETSAELDRSWQIGDPIVEPDGAYQLEDGSVVLSRECD